VDERLRFVARLLEGENMAAMCREFDISRKTGYKIFSRFKDFGLEGLTDRSRRPYRHANRLPFQIEATIVQLKQEHPSWGAPKIREKLRRRCSDIQLPAISTVHAVLDRHGLVTRGRRQPRYKAQGTPLSSLLLPPHRHRLRQPLPIVLRRPGGYPRGLCLQRVRTRLQGLWPAQVYPQR